MLRVTLNRDKTIRILVAQIRADLADLLPPPDILKGARKKGVSRLITKLETDGSCIPREHGQQSYVLTIQARLYSTLDALKVLNKVFGLKKLTQAERDAAIEFDADVEALVEMNANDDVPLTREEAARALAPYYGRSIDDL